MSRSVVVIGSGLGGLTCAAMLARSGYRVTVLEQQSQIGGCLQCFTRHGARFETGMHFVGSADEGQVFANYLHFLGIREKVPLSRLDTRAYEVVSLQGERFAFANGREAMTEQLSERFPHQREQLRRYWQLVDEVVQLTPYYRLQPYNPSALPVSSRLFTTSVNEVLAQCISDPLLQEVLAGNAALYAGQKDCTPFSTHAFIADFYNRSAFRVVGGSDAIAKALAEEILAHGGAVLTKQQVLKIKCKNGKMAAVETAAGSQFAADLFVSDIHPSLLLPLFEEKAAWQQTFRNRIARMYNTTSVFSLFLRFKENSLPYRNGNFYGFRCGSPWEMLPCPEAEWPKGYLFMPHCMRDRQPFAESGVVLAYMSIEELRRWEGTRSGQRGEAYEAFKKRKAERLLAALAEDFPELPSAIASYETATPLTYRDYTGTPEGAMYGLAKDVNLGMGGRISWRTKLPNLFLVGQNTNAHGALGVMVGSLNVALHLLGIQEVNRRMLAAQGHRLEPQPAVASEKTADTLVMGGGLGGLMTAALLAKSGQKVMVLEKNAVIGGGLQCFRRGEALFPTGMHVFGGFQPGGQIHRLCAYLGILDQLDIRYTDEEAFDEVLDLRSGERFCFPKGRKAYTDYLCWLYPHESEGIHAYVEAMYRLSEEEDLFYLREKEEGHLVHSEEFFLPVDQFISHYIRDERLRALLSYTSPLYAAVEGETPAYIHALINISHINGSAYFARGSQQLADRLADIVRAQGGSVLAREEVTRVEVENHRVRCVRTGSGRQYRAENYISDLHPQLLLGMISEGAFPASFRQRIGAVRETYSAFKVYISFKPNSYRHVNHPVYCSKGGPTWRHVSAAPEVWPQGLMCMTYPDAEGRYARTMVVIAVMSYEWVRPWEDTFTGHRGAAYADWKERQTQKVLAFLEEAFPGIGGCIACRESSSPLTIRDYTGNKEGSLYGLHRDGNHILQSQLFVNTKVGNLFLTGQNTNLHGMCGVALTAIATSCTLLGNTRLITQISQEK